MKVAFLTDYDSTMQISDLAIRAGVTARTIPSCEEFGILES